VNIINFIWLCTGTTLTIASACVLNNYLDQDIDAKMSRTKKRAAWIETAGPRNVIIFAAIIGILGFILLALLTNWWVVGIEIVGYVDYVVLYGMWTKRTSWHGTVVGAISGAAPILAGYAGAAHTVDLGGLLVFLVIFVWQMPEFYSISIYRRDEYKAAGVPVISVKKGVRFATFHIFAYTVLFVAFSLLLGATGYTSIVYMVIMTLVGAYWLWLGAKGFHANDSSAWARRMFKFSLTALLVFCALISIDALLP
jgi:protoheme IX farnesyltransferase